MMMRRISGSFLRAWLHPGVGWLLELLVPAFGRLELLGVALGLESEALDDGNEAVALLGRRGADPAAHDVVHLDLARAALLGDRLGLVTRGRIGEVAQRLWHHAHQREEHRVRAVGPVHPIAS